MEKEKRELKAQCDEKLKRYAVQFALKQAGGRNTKALLALVNLEEITLKEEGEMENIGIEGLDIKKLKKEVPYLFEEEENKRIEGRGYNSSNRESNKKSEMARQFESALMRR